MTSPDAQEARQAAERTLTVLDDLVQAVVQQALDEMADDVADLIRDAARDELQAALDATTLRQIIRLWRRRLPRVLAALLAVVEAAVRAVLRRFGAPMPPEWEDLPGRWADDPFSVPDRVRQYVSTAENRLAEVGDRLWEAARDALREGNDEGEGIDQLARRLRRVFAEDGAELGRARAERIARTEVISAWNRASLDAPSAMPESARPPYKAWLATVDTRTRPAHWAADGQVVSVAAPFIVGGEPLMTPGDPIGSPDNVINCRCTFILTYTQDVPEDAGRQFLNDDEIAEVIRYFEEEHGIVREAHRSALTAASGGPYTGGMVALVPSQADIDRLVVEDGEQPEDLHLTLLFLGNGADVPTDTRQQIVTRLAEIVDGLRDEDQVAMPVQGHGFALSVFNPNDAERDACIVLGVGGNDLQTVRNGVGAAVTDLMELPEQHAPWVPHVTLTYTDDLAQLPSLADRTGPIVFDRLRVAFGDDITDIPLAPAEQEAAAVTTPTPAPRRWSTPGQTALAFENVQTGDGRVFAPGALYWENGPWPLQYADEMLTGHEGAELAGAIETLGRVGDRIPATGVLYPSQAAGASAIRLLEEGAPLGVSVDLDDVDVELIDRRPPEERDNGEEGGEVVLLASLAAASVLHLPGGGHLVRATHVTEQTASGRPVRATHTVEWSIGPNGCVPAADLHAAFAASGIITAAAGDADDAAGQVVMSERAGDMVMRITRGRVRGATLVSMPAFAQARIVLDADELAAAGDEAAPPGGRMREVVACVAGSPVPVGAAQVADALGISTASARDYMARAAAAGHIVRLARGLYVAASTIPEGLVAAMSGDLDLPIHDDRDAEWDGDAAASRVLAWATGEDGEVDAARLGSAFLWRDPDATPATLAAYKLGIADLYQRDGGQRLEIVPRAVFAVAAVLQGARGGVDIPAEEQEELRYRVSGLYRRLAEVFDERLVAPWDEDENEEMDDLEASAWQEFQQLPPLPAEWFREPTKEELPTDQGPVHVTDDGRIFGWVARRGVCHDGYTGQCVTIDQLGDVDTTYFLRSRIKLDSGETIRVGVFTMNAGHDNDGTDAASTRALFDDTRTVAGIVTVGTNDRGMWFSGAAAPWVSAWDMATFAACAPSGHWRRDRGGRWSLRAVLSVPVPGYPTRLAASAVARANLALTASAAPRPGPVPGVDLDALAAALAPAVVDEMERRQAAREEVERLAAELAPVRAEIAASMAAQIKGGN